MEENTDGEHELTFMAVPVLGFGVLVAAAFSYWEARRARMQIEREARDAHDAHASDLSYEHITMEDPPPSVHNSSPPVDEDWPLDSSIGQGLQPANTVRVRFLRVGYEGQSVSRYIENDQTVLQVKQRVFQSASQRGQRVTMVFQGRIMRDSQRFSGYLPDNDCAVHTVISAPREPNLEERIEQWSVPPVAVLGIFIGTLLSIFWLLAFLHGPVLFSKLGVFSLLFLTIIFALISCMCAAGEPQLDGFDEHEHDS